MTPPPGSEAPRRFPFLTTLAVMLYSAIPLFLIFQRGHWMSAFAEVDMQLPMITVLILSVPMPVVGLVVLVVNGLLIWAAWKGSNRLSRNLNIAALVGVALFVGMWLVGIFMPLIKIRADLGGAP